jgi:hypothetical protein
MVMIEFWMMDKGLSCGGGVGFFVVLGDFLIVLFDMLVLAGTWGIFVVKVAVMLAFSGGGRSESQLREVISWEGSTW